MIKTPDNVSKYRQKLGLQVEEWKGKIRDLEHSVSLTEEDRIKKTQQLAFCKEELRRCRAAIVATQNEYTKAQVSAGWVHLR